MVGLGLVGVEPGEPGERLRGLLAAAQVGSRIDPLPADALAALAPLPALSGMGGEGLDVRFVPFDVTSQVSISAAVKPSVGADA